MNKMMMDNKAVNGTKASMAMPSNRKINTNKSDDD